MDARFLDYYNRELRHLREMGGEFSKQFPKVAGRLGLDAFECADPYVERLLEGFAFLAARVQLKIDSEFPGFTEQLLEMVCPHYLPSTPSMAVVQLAPSYKQGSLASGVLVPRNTVLRSNVGRSRYTSCEYRTAHEVRLFPIRQLDRAQETQRLRLSRLEHEIKEHLATALAFRRLDVRLVLRGELAGGER